MPTPMPMHTERHGSARRLVREERVVFFWLGEACRHVGRVLGQVRVALARNGRQTDSVETRGHEVAREFAKCKFSACCTGTTIKAYRYILLYRYNIRGVPVHSACLRADCSRVAICTGTNARVPIYPG
uniref:Uncharacterized protein n=1 Tax=Ananas comosus var. bracteatus TaxID=296719 RepID=A0A6V7P9A9_ANACO|nr:unnamed protein product [Ananas comosus var. bracteatus]